ncbi:MAG TPA: polysaccharide deacetylase family protein, partial [Burkholderiaceae bacterium]|nr:polysaccharide deacetylase family protein [Burkholderiaceae bacterium]
TSVTGTVRRTRSAPSATPVAPPSPAAERLLAEDERLRLVLPGPGATFADLARRWLGDPTRGWEIAALNGLAAPRAGEPLLLPRRALDPLGLVGDRLQTVTVLCYHRIGSGLGRMGVTPEQFAQQMEWLSANGYHIVRLSDLADQLDGRRALPPNSLVITFDDGYESVHRHAYPVLRRLGLPATLFLYTDFVGGGGDALSWPQVREMAASGLIDFQAHSRTHANLAQRRAGESDAAYRQRLDEEVSGSREAIQRRLDGAPVQHFAYPFGDSNDAVREALRRRHYELGLTVQPGGNPAYAPPLLLRRTMIFGSHDLEAFKARLQVQRPLPGPRS